MTDIVYDFFKNKNILCYRGSENDVLERFYQCNQLLNSNIIIRLTCDCPYLDIEMLNDMINYFKINNLDYDLKYIIGCFNGMINT